MVIENHEKNVANEIGTDDVKLTSIGESTFLWCMNLTSITIPNGVTSIGLCAFFWCESLPSITIPGGVTSIGAAAFEACDNIVISAPRDSYAIEYAKENGIKYMET